jgi:hypothetical protein
MLGNLYYFFTLILIIFNLLMIANFFKFYRITEWMLTFNKVTGKLPNKEDFKEGEFELNSFLSCVVIFNFTWIFFGILSKSWVIYLAMLLLSLVNFIITSLISLIWGRFSLINKIFNFCFFIVITVSLCVLTINHYHLHLELSDYLLKIFK